MEIFIIVFIMPDRVIIFSRLKITHLLLETFFKCLIAATTTGKTKESIYLMSVIGQVGSLLLFYWLILMVGSALDMCDTCTCTRVHIRHHQMTCRDS